MARIRSLKPEFWSDVKMVRLSFAARLFYQGLWSFSMCDHGHLQDDVEQLKMNIFPCDDVDPQALLDELMALGRVARLESPDGKTYLHVKKLADHSRVDSRWSSRCPACSAELQEARPNSSEPSGAPAGSRKHPLEGKGREGKKTSSTAARSMAPDPDFEKFWAVYPRKVGKGAARKAWDKAIKARADPADVIAAAERYRDDPKRQREDIKYTAHPATWLNSERWLDQPEEPTLTGPRPFWEN